MNLHFLVDVDFTFVVLTTVDVLTEVFDLIDFVSEEGELVFFLLVVFLVDVAGDEAGRDDDAGRDEAGTEELIDGTGTVVFVVGLLLLTGLVVFEGELVFLVEVFLVVGVGVVFIVLLFFVEVVFFVVRLLVLVFFDVVGCAVEVVIFVVEAMVFTLVVRFVEVAAGMLALPGGASLVILAVVVTTDDFIPSKSVLAPFATLRTAVLIADSLGGALPIEVVLAMVIELIIVLTALVLLGLCRFLKSILRISKCNASSSAFAASSGASSCIASSALLPSSKMPSRYLGVVSAASAVVTSSSGNRLTRSSRLTRASL